MTLLMVPLLVTLLCYLTLSSHTISSQPKSPLHGQVPGRQSYGWLHWQSFSIQDAHIIFNRHFCTAPLGFMEKPGSTVLWLIQHHSKEDNMGFSMNGLLDPSIGATKFYTASNVANFMSILFYMHFSYLHPFKICTFLHGKSSMPPVMLSTYAVEARVYNPACEHPSPGDWCWPHQKLKCSDGLWLLADIYFLFKCFAVDVDMIIEPTRRSLSVLQALKALASILSEPTETHPYYWNTNITLHQCGTVTYGSTIVPWKDYLQLVIFRVPWLML